MTMLTRPANAPQTLRRYLEATLRALATGSPVPGPERRPVNTAVPFAFAAWIDYLFFLDALVEARLALRPSEIFPEERRGLELLRQAREAFWRRHELCPGCGALITRGGTCALCALEFAGNPKAKRQP